MDEIAPVTSMPETIPQKRVPWGRILAWIALFALLAVVAVGLLMKQQGPVQIGKSAPPYSLTSFEGVKYSSESLRGKVVLINFWASWCKPCEQEAPYLEQAWREYQPGGQVVFLGIDWTDTETPAKAFIARFDVTYPNGPDLGTRISQRYRITGVPESYIIDQKGILRAARFSAFESVEEIKSIIDPLLTTP